MNRNILAFALLVPALASASTWSLDSCIAYAREHNISVQTKKLDCKSAEYDITEAYDGFLPNISGQAGETLSFGRGLTANNTYANRNTENFNVGANLQLPLFQGLSGIRRVNYAKASLRTMVEQLETEKDNIELNVIGAYLQALYTRELVDVAEEQLRMSRYELNRRSILVEEGKLPELDLFEAQSQVSQDELSVTTASNDARLALVDLKQLLEIPVATDMELEPLESTASKILPNSGEIINHALTFNHSMRAANLGIEAADKQISLARSGYIPTLGFSAGISTNYYKVSGVPNQTFRQQMRENFSKSIGFNLNIPIFDGLSTRNSVRKAKLRKQQAMLQKEQTALALEKAIEQAYCQVENASEKEKASMVAENAASKALEGVLQKYNYGKATASEYEQSRSTYLKAKIQTVQARYERILRTRILEFYNR